MELVSTNSRLESRFQTVVYSVNNYSIAKTWEGLLPQSLEKLVISPSVLSLENHFVEPRQIQLYLSMNRTQLKKPSQMIQ